MKDFIGFAKNFKLNFFTMRNMKKYKCFKLHSKRSLFLEDIG